MKVKLNVVESYRVDTQSEADAAIEEARSEAMTKGYDVTYTIDKAEEGKRRGAWLSNEYRNCGNGHYGLLLDATHAVFYEDD